MNKSKIIEVITQVLHDLQSASGRGGTQITQGTCPIGDLDQFDSLNGVEATSELSERLGFDLPGVNIFVSDDGTKARTVTETADCICEIAASKGSK